MPVHINEPMGMLQTLSQLMEYTELLVKAGECDDPVMRLIYIGVFNVSLFCCSDKRVSKPFNPLLGETFEIQNKDYRYISE